MILLSYSKAKLDTLYDELHKANRGGNAHLARVIIALILVGEKKHTLEEIIKLVNVTGRTLFNWIKQFMCHGITWFSRHWFKGRGRKSRLTKAQRKELREMIEQGPQAHGFNCGVWNTAMINELIKLKFSVSYNERYLARLLKKIGLSYQKARFISDRLDEEEYLKKREEWLEKTLPEILLKAKEKGLSGNLRGQEFIVKQ
jgi:transposase